MNRCTQCGEVIEADQAGGLCPVCLLDAGLKEDEDNTRITQGIDEAWMAKQGLSPVTLDSPASNRFGDFELQGEIGRGGMGLVYKARHATLNRVVALKMILAGPVASPEFSQRFRTEARAAAALEHPHIVPIYEVGEIEGQQYYTMPLVEGGNLAEYLQRKGRPDAHQAAAWVRTLAAAVHYAHQRGVLHRDLKPANILLDAGLEPHITDFGLAKLMDDDSAVTLSHSILGTPNYMSPEQASGRLRDLTMASDVYSLGAILWELLTGKRLFEGPSPLATIQSVLEKEPVPPSSCLKVVPPDLDTICLKCLQKESSRRYKSARELAEDLERWLNGEPILARRVGLAERTWLWCRRKPAMAGVVSAAVVILLATASVAAWRIRAAAQQEELQRYIAKIREANQAIEDGAVDRALDALVQCPESLRHWEWGRLLYECLQEVATLPVHTNAPQFLVQAFVAGMEFDPVGGRLASLGVGGDLALSDPLEGRLLWRLQDTNNPVLAHSFRPGTSQLAVSRLDGRLQAFDADSGVLLEEWLPRHPDGPESGPDLVDQSGWGSYSPGPIRNPLPRRPWAIKSMAWDSNGERMLIVQASGKVSVALEPFVTPQWSWAPSGPTEEVTAWFAPQSGRVVIQSPGMVQQLDPSTGRRFGLMEWPKSSVLRGTASVSPEGDLAILVDPEWAARLKQLDGPDLDLGSLATEAKNAPFKAFFNQDGSLFCALGGTGRAMLFDVRTGRPRLRFPYPVYGGAFSIDHRQIAVFGPARAVHIWDIESGLEVRQLNGHLSTVSAVHYDPTGRMIATASREGVIKTWTAPPPDPVLFGETITTGSNYSPDGRWLATGPSWRGVQLWDAHTGELRWSRPSRTQLAFHLRFSPDSQRLYVAGSDRNIRILAVEDGRLEGMLVGHERFAITVGCSPDGKWVASGDFAGKLIIWDAVSLEKKQVIEAQNSEGDGTPSVWDVEFDRNSRWVATAGRGAPQVWNVADGKLLATLDENRAETMNVTFSPTSDHVLGAGADHVIRKWELPSGTLVDQWNTTSQGSSKLAHTSDGRRFALVVADMATWGFSVPAVEVWDAEQGRMLLSRAMHADAVYSVGFDSANRHLTTASMDTTVRQWEAFPWRDSDYQGVPGEDFLRRARHYAEAHWREELHRERPPAAAYRLSEADPLPPGIPDWERVRWPVRDERASEDQVNLDRYYTGLLDSCFYVNWMEPEWADELSSLPSGLQTFGGVLFDVRGVIWLLPALAYPGDQVFGAACHDYPTRVEGIRIGRTYSTLHVLHAANTLRYVPRPDPDLYRSGTLAVASYVLHYADGEELEHEVVYGRDLRHWWQGRAGDPAAETTRARVVWRGSNVTASLYDAELRLFLSSFPNPRPDVEVVSIDFISKETPFAPFLVAMTVEE